MRRFVLGMMVFSAVSSFSSSGLVISKLDMASVESFSYLMERFRKPFYNYFSKLLEEKVVSGVYKIEPDIAMGISPFAQVNINLPVNQMDCEAVLCKDILAQKLVNTELKEGRLILLSRPYGGAAGITIESHPSLEPFYRIIDSKADKNKALLVLSPEAAHDVIHHELNHAYDYENSELAEVLESVELLIKDKKKLKLITSYIMEYRSYQSQEKYLKTNIRSTEYVFNEDTYRTETKNGIDYLEDVLWINNKKIKMYEERYESAMSKTQVTPETIQLIRELVDKAKSLPVLFDAQNQ